MLPALIAFQVFAAPAHTSSSPRVRFDASVENLRSTAIRFDASAEAAAFLVIESQAGIDLNGDGDLTDTVLHVTPRDSATVTSLGLACDLTFEAAGQWIAFTVREAAQGGVDLNGDGDANDSVLHVYDSLNPNVINLQRAVDFFALGEHVIAYGARESDLGSDQNADGDLLDRVMEVVKLDTGHRFSTGLATGVGAIVRADQAVFLVPEFTQGSTDLNGDGDAADALLHVANATTDTAMQVGRATTMASVAYEPPHLAYVVDESMEGLDANGDADLTDRVLEVLDVALGTTLFTGPACEDLKLVGGRIAARVRESSHGMQDLNGDGDANDTVLFAGPISQGPPQNLGWTISASHHYDIAGTQLVALVEESSGVDLNGDTDLVDRVAHVRDLASGVSRNLGLACVGFRARGDSVAMRVDESAQGAMDLNGNGVSNDFVLHVYDRAADRTANIGVAIPFSSGAEEPFVAHVGRFLAFVRTESGDDLDLNDDGDKVDFVVQLLHLGSGERFNLALASLQSAIPPTILSRSRTLLFRVNETQQGGSDLNGDGDANDDVLHVAWRLAR